MRRYLIAAFAVLISWEPVMAEDSNCRTLIEHSESDTANPWRTVNDAVMGGRSTGGSMLRDGVLLFAGSTNTNGGGFSSIRLPVKRGSLAGTDYLKLHMQRDARAYSVTLRTNVRLFGRRIAFRAPIVEAPEAAWGDGVLRFDRLKASLNGRSVSGAVFDPGEVVEVGLIIYDGEDGPFEMRLKRIEACSATKEP